MEAMTHQKRLKKQEKQPNPQPLMSPDDLSIAPYARQSYLERYNSTEQGAPFEEADPLLNKRHGKTDMHGYEKSKQIPFGGVGGMEK